MTTHDSARNSEKRASGHTTGALEGADAQPTDALMGEVYDELRRLGRHFMHQEGPGQTLTPTALVHEAYVRLSNSGQLQWVDDRHFYLAAAQAMRRILVDRARAKGTQRRGGGRERVNLEIAEDEAFSSSVDLVSWDRALSRLSLESERAAQVVMLRFVVGLSLEQTASTLGVSPATVTRDWQYARAWLHDALGDDLC